MTQFCEFQNWKLVAKQNSDYKTVLVHVSCIPFQNISLTFSLSVHPSVYQSVLSVFLYVCLSAWMSSLYLSLYLSLSLPECLQTVCHYCHIFKITKYFVSSGYQHVLKYFNLFHLIIVHKIIHIQKNMWWWTQVRC